MQPAGGLAGARHLALEQHALALPLQRRVGDGNRRQQRLRIGVQRLLVEFRAGRQLHQLAEIHDRHAGRDVADHAEVMRDEQVGQLQVLLQLLQQVDDLGLDGDVERRDRLVADDEVGRGGERAGDADPLPLAAGELVRIAVAIGRG